MPRLGRLLVVLGCALTAALAAAQSRAAAPELNPIARGPVAIGPAADRLIVGFRATSADTVTQIVSVRRGALSYRITQARTSASDVAALAQRTGLRFTASRQITPSMHVLFLPKIEYGADLLAALDALRADPGVQFAVADAHRYALLVPSNPLFAPTPGEASGQWYMNTPGPATVEGVQTMDYAATDAVSAWNITTGSAGIVIADVDTGILFDHPDLLRAGRGGRLLPGYDFVGQDYAPTSPYAGLGTFDIANDGDGWDPDPSDPGDWVSQADIDNPNRLFANDSVANSSWHGTRVMGILGAITDNDVGTAGMTWGTASAPGPWVLPVRALGKGGGYDSDIIAGMEWAAGLAVTNPDGSAVPANPYPADIINLSIGGGTDSCASEDGMAYATALGQVSAVGVVVVIAAGNGTGAPVELPANCAGSIAGVMAVAGLRNVGTKVGFSSIGPQVSIAAPAGNCINSAGPCLRSIDTTTDSGLTSPGIYGYTDETQPNLGTSFAAPIVAGIAALMRSVNGNLSPAQVAERLEESASAFPPNTGDLPVCPTLAADGSDQCSCLGSGQCGAGMVNAYHAVQSAERPIAAVAIPRIVGASSVMLNASGSAASCGRSLASYAWKASGAAGIVAGADAAKVTITPPPPGDSGALTLTVTDSMGASDIATIALTSQSATSSAPAEAGSAPCPREIHPIPVAPRVAAAFSPAVVAPAAEATLIFTLSNANSFALTQSQFTATIPAGLALAAAPGAATTCTGASATVRTTASAVSLHDANIPANGSCTVSVTIDSAAAGAYSSSIGPGALVTGPAGGNLAPASATLTVSVPVSPSASGGGALDEWDMLYGVAVLLIVRRKPQSLRGTQRKQGRL